MRLFTRFFDEGPEEDNNLSQNTQEVDHGDICAKMPEAQVYCHQHRPHQKGNNEEVTPWIKPD